jgi:DNA-binding XRE family transcriptional regulator
MESNIIEINHEEKQDLENKMEYEIKGEKLDIEINTEKILKIENENEQTLEDLLFKSEICKQLTFTLSVEDIFILKEILTKCPLSFINIKNNILEIVKDNKIDLADIPIFLKLIKDIYVIYHENILNTKVSYDSISKLLKYIIHIILKQNNLGNQELLNSCDNIIEISVEMIKLHLKSKKSCFFKLC